MKASTATQTTKVSLKQAAQAVTSVADMHSVLVQGRPGIGKSSILKGMPNTYIKSYMDCSTLDLGDVGMPVIDKLKMQTNYAPNARFRIHDALEQGKPLAIMLDEIGKAPKAVQNMLLPLIQERRLGDVELPEGSIVFSTTNLASDGVNDKIEAHVYNRNSTIICSGPTAQDWADDFAIPNGLEASVIVWAIKTPQLFKCYTEFNGDIQSAKENPYIFNPEIGNIKQFTSPRSMHMLSNIVSRRSKMDEATFHAMIEGTVGKPAANDFHAYLKMQDKLEDWETIINHPEKARIPDGVACWMQAFRCAARMDASTVEAVTKYVARWDADEGKALFCKSALTRENMIGSFTRHMPFTRMAGGYGKVIA